MNEVYGISPHLGVSARELGLLLNLFGFRHGRFLARFPRPWVRALLDSLKDASDIERKRFTTLFKSREALFLSLGEPYDAAQTWMQNALHLLDRSIIDGLVTEDAVCRPYVYSVDDFASSKVPDSAGIRTSATAENLIRFMRPVILTGSEIVLVDRYVCMASPRYQAFLRRLATNALSSGKTYRVFSDAKHFIIKESLSSQSLRCFSDGFANGCEFFFYMRDDPSNMHGRYAFNVHGGVKYDKGFGVERDVEVDIEVMSETTHSQYFELYASLIKDSAPVWHASARAGV